MVDISQLSAKELYELAKQKEQEEAKFAQMQEKRTKLENEREELLQKHQEDIAVIDRQIEELTVQRERMIGNVNIGPRSNGISGVFKGQEITQAEKTSSAEQPAAAKATPVKEEKATPSAPIEKKEPPKVKERAQAETKEGLIGEDLPPPSEEQGKEHKDENPAPKSKGDSDELDILMEYLHQIMKGRSYISDSLLREKLQSLKFKPSNLSKLLDTLVRQAKLVRRSGGNYVLGRMAKK